jgi:hypothetical protein
MDEKLKLALTAAKSAVHNFAVVAKGPAVVELLVSKTPIKDADVQAAKKQHGGNAVMRGKCQGKDGELVFRVAKDPTVEDKKLKEFITKATNLPIKPRFEVVTDEDVEGDEGSEADSEQGAGANKLEGDKTTSNTGTPPQAPPPPPPPPLPPTATGDASAFTARLKAIKSDMDIVRGAETSVTAEVKKLSADVGALAAKKKFDEAIRVLDLIEPLVRKGQAELSGQTKAPNQDAAKKNEPGKPNANESAQAFASRFKTLKSAVDQAIAGKTPQGAQIQSLAGEMAAAAKKGDFAAAGKLLDQIEKSLSGGSGETASDPTEAEWKRRFAAIEPRVQEAKKTRASESKWQLMYMSAEELGSQGNFRKALEVLDRLEKTLAVPPKKTATATSGFAVSNVALQQSVLAWDAARKKAHAGLEELEKKIMELFSGDARLAEITKSARKLDSVLGGYAEELRDWLDEAYNAPVERKPALCARAVASLKRYRAYLRKDAFVKSVSSNNLHPVDIEGILGKTLDDVAKNLGA